MAVVRLCTSVCCIYGYSCISAYYTCVRATAALFLFLMMLSWLLPGLPLGARIHPVSLLLTNEAFILVTVIEYISFKVLEMQRAGDFLLHIYVYTTHTSVCVEVQLN